MLASKSAIVASLLEKKTSNEVISSFLRNLPATSETFELVLRFCYGYDITVSTDNVVPLACLACQLEMDESRVTNNLISKLISFFNISVLPNWDETLKALRNVTTHNNLRLAKQIGLFDACVDSLVDKARQNPRRLCDATSSDPLPARRKLFVEAVPISIHEAEELTDLPLQIYEPVISAMIRCGEIPAKYVAASVVKYTEKWVMMSCFFNGSTEKVSAYRKTSVREIVEAIVRLIPKEEGVFPCSLLFSLLRISIILEASVDCINGFEVKAGKQLEEASVNDLALLILPSHDDDVDKKHHVEVQCLKRILQSFYRSFNSSDPSGLLRVAELVEEYLGQIVASSGGDDKENEINLGIEEFVGVADLAVAASLGTKRGCDGIYRAIDMYLEKHKGLTEAEKEQVCSVLDCQNLSSEALQHAAQNSRLPLRVVVQVLFVGQLHLRDKIAIKTNEEEDEEEVDVEEEDDEGEEIGLVKKKVKELERESEMMKKEIKRCQMLHRGVVGKEKEKENASVWKKMKRKFGCISGINESTCGGVNKKKVHPKHGNGVRRHD